MKKTDIAMIILIAAIAVGGSYAIGYNMFGKQSQKPVKVQTIEEISSETGEPDGDVFNKNAINPTVETIIGQGNAP